jgi:hypothetical protein
MSRANQQPHEALKDSFGGTVSFCAICGEAVAMLKVISPEEKSPAQARSLRVVSGHDLIVEH